MKSKKIVWMGSLLGALLWIMNSCYYDAVIPVEPSADELGDIMFAADIIPIFNSSCNISSCHSAGGQKPNLTGESAYNSLINGGYINTVDPERSELYEEMEGVNGTPMPPSGSNATYNAKVLAWIKQGALNN